MKIAIALSRKVKSHALLLFIVWAVFFVFCYGFYGIVIFY